MLEDFLLPFQATAFYPTVKVELGGVRGILQYFALRLGHTGGFANEYDLKIVPVYIDKNHQEKSIRRTEPRRTYKFPELGRVYLCETSLKKQRARHNRLRLKRAIVH